MVQNFSPNTTRLANLFHQTLTFDRTFSLISPRLYQTSDKAFRTFISIVWFQDMTWNITTLCYDVTRGFEEQGE